MTKRLLVVDDVPEIGDFVRRVAESAGYEVRTTVNARAFQDAYRTFDPDVIALDLAMPEVDGIELLEALADEGCRAQLLIVSGFDFGIQQSAARLAEARGLRIAGIVPKPLRAQRLREILDALASDADSRPEAESRPSS